MGRGGTGGWGDTGFTFAPGAPGSPWDPAAVDWDGVCGSGTEKPPPQPCLGCRQLLKVMGPCGGCARPGRTGILRDVGQALTRPEALIPMGLLWRGTHMCFSSVFPPGVCFPSKSEHRSGFCCGFVRSLLP